MRFKPTWSTKSIGDVAETRALNWMQRQGLKLIRRNYRCRQGEIDLIMRDGEFLVFIEVRQRALSTHGAASETVTLRKQRRILMAARHFIANYRISADQCMRFDVIGLGPHEESDAIDWIPNAFSG